MPQTYNPPTIPARPFRARHLVVAVLVLGGAVWWLTQTFRRGQFVADASGVTMVTNTRPADGARDVLPNVFISAYLNPGHAIDPNPKTLNEQTVRLYRAGDGISVLAHVKTSAAGDDIVLTPNAMLEPGTQYTFEVKGVKDLAGEELLPFKMSFTTSNGSATSDYPAAFEKVELAGERAFYTGLTVGPDHRLYAGTADGKILRHDILPDGTLGPAEAIKTLQSANNGPRLITGIAFDLKATADRLVLWVSHGQLILNERGEPSLVGATDWTGKISTLSGPDLGECRDVVVNLPRSWRDHLNNQIDFGPDGCVYWSQGSHTAMGAPDQKWGGSRVERLLSAAVLKLDPGKVTGTLDAKTPDGGGTYDPFAIGAPLTIFASGVRVGYDMLWHSNGHLYTAVNGSAQGGNAPATPADRNYPRRIDGDIKGAYAGPEIAAVFDVDQTQPDLLLKLEQGGYYGQPNPLRGEYVLNGGNPTDRKDPLEVSKYPVGTMPDRNWRRPLYDFGASASPNGMIEYRGPGELHGKLLVTRLNGNDIIAVALDRNGDVAETITGISGLTSFTEPLDLAQDASSGRIYVAEYRGGKLALLRPITDPASLTKLHPSVFRQQIRASAE